MAKKKKKTTGIVRGYATVSAPKPTAGVQEQESVAQSDSPLPPTPPPLGEDNDKENHAKPCNDEQGDPTTTDHTAATRLARLQLSSTLEKSSQRLASRLPTLHLTPTLEHALITHLSCTSFLTTHDWFAPESTLPTSLIRLHFVYLYLQHLGFTPDVIEKAMLAVGGQNVEGIVQWICLSVPSEELPNGFANVEHRDAVIRFVAVGDGNTGERDAVIANVDGESVCTDEAELSRNDTAEQVTGQDDETLGTGNDDEEEKGVLEPCTQDCPTVSKPSTVDSEVKSWILNRDWSDSDDDSSTETPPPAPTPRYATLALTLEALKDAAAEAKTNRRSSEQKSVGEQIRKVIAEMRDLETCKGFVRGEAERLIEEGRKKRAVTESFASVKELPTTEKSDEKNKEEDEDFEIDILNTILAESPTSPTRFTPQAVLQTAPYTIPKTWTGSTPKDLLQTHLSRLSVTPKYSRTRSDNGWRVSVRFPGTPPEEVTIEIGNGGWKVAEQIVATKALYSLAPHLPLHRSLPPAYKELWLNMEDEERRAVEAETRVGEERRMRFLEDLRRVRDERLRSYASTPTPVTHDDPPPPPSPRLPPSTWATRKQSAQYISLLKDRQGLPVYKARQEILALIQSHRVLVVSGETGSGKSTQIPQFIVEDAVERGQHVHVICTQPRRISATSIATRVSAEIGDTSLGNREAWVGYHIRNERRVGVNARLVFCTLGVLLNMLEHTAQLEHVTHIVVDEVHERGLDSDFLVRVCERLLGVRTDLRIILMSATADATRFAAYFDKYGPVPVYTVPGRTFEVQKLFLEDVIEQTGFVAEEWGSARGREGYVDISGRGGRRARVRFEWNEPLDGDDDVEDNDGDADSEDLPTTYSPRTHRALRTLRTYPLTQPNYDLLEHLIAHLTATSHSGSILVFLPGLAAIRTLSSRLAHLSNITVHELHSSLPPSSQASLFLRSRQPKVILSTNIAETGITIPDVTIVIDTLLHRRLTYDPKRDCTRLVDRLCCKASGRQRAGRAGRVSSGTWYALLERRRWESLPERDPPDMALLPVTELALKIRSCALFSPDESIDSVLAGCLDPPPPQHTRKAITILQSMDALDANEQITPLGRLLSRIPLDVRLGLAALFAARMGQECLNVVVGGLAYLTLGKRVVIDESLGIHSASIKYSTSDVLSVGTLLHQFRTTPTPRAWCRSHNLHYDTFLSLQDLAVSISRIISSLALTPLPVAPAPSLALLLGTYPALYASHPTFHALHSTTPAHLTPNPFLSNLPKGLYTSFAPRMTNRGVAVSDVTGVREGDVLLAWGMRKGELDLGGGVLVGGTWFGCVIKSVLVVRAFCESCGWTLPR
ncbi:uncharacterized protein SPPG_07041 [Spizellomyces punctatus DAOM BR117]|uniref:RNA helicase n=1 Tax=Spizellomyces punctatus (strain DAOM BR117) TaxID=645134 RepID=A0A0L0HA80_SPIPD|nr:uncharacterized protein SPPG_07041 [Spizellomyces punctatus DAOM BR117]KNC97568.1 hypothetical protein SPPG_07041 [Spizellomyces punctatus DAOM BR117]|eukprot:XP_016605608.1 hypothetical protein SPPG_07041 [Spizellomyces punctatus DAOM BR117]